jgi:Bacterial Ig-like domain (group 3)
MKTSWKIWAIIGAVAVISMATVGVAYASNGSVTTDCSNTQSLCVFSWVKCNNGASIPATTATIINDGDTITFNITHAYPGSHSTIIFGVMNKNATPGVVSSIILNCPQYFDMTLNGITKGQVIDTNKEVAGALDITFLNSAPNSTMDKTYNMSVTILVTQSIQQTPNKTQTILGSLPNPSDYGQPVIFGATVISSGFKSIPTGTVKFMEGGTLLGTGTLDKLGLTSFTTSKLPVGSHNITAVYSGDSNFAGSSSNVVVQKVRSKTTVSWPSKPGPCNFGKILIFIARIEMQSPGMGNPTGTVTFCDGTKTLGTVNVSADGQTKFSISSLSRGIHNITAVYNGDDNCYTSSNTFSQVIN